MSLSSSSSVHQAQQVLAARLLEIRRNAGLTGRELARRCGWHPSKVSRIENANSPPSASDVTAWAEHCAVSDQVNDLVASLRTVEGMWVEWRRMTHGGLRPVQASYQPLYERTNHFRAYTASLIPGMIQTRAYATAVFTTIQQRDNLVEDVEAATDVRIARQRLLHDGDRRFAFLIEEFVLRSVVGDSDVMRTQLSRLLTIGALPNVSLGIVPMQVVRSRWPVESFWLFGDGLVDVELVSGQLNISQPRERGSGHIIQVSSIGGISAFPGVGAYHASKWALEGFSQALSQEVAGFGIHVTLIEPGGFSTDWSGPSAMHSQQISEYDGLREGRRQRVSANPPGDPTATRSAILKVADAEKPPLRVFFGAAPLTIATTDYESRLATWHEWRPVSVEAQGS